MRGVKRLAARRPSGKACRETSEEPGGTERTISASEHHTRPRWPFSSNPYCMAVSPVEYKASPGCVIPIAGIRLDNGASVGNPDPKHTSASEDAVAFARQGVALRNCQVLHEVLVENGVHGFVRERYSPCEVPRDVDLLWEEIDVDPAVLSKRPRSEVQSQWPRVYRVLNASDGEWADGCCRCNPCVSRHGARDDAL